MTDVERIEQRLSAVERTLTGEIDIDAEALQDVLALSAEVEALDERIDGLEDRIAELEGDLQSVGGYLSEVDSVNESVERQALSAVATVDRLEDRVDDVEETVHRLDPEAERDLQDAVEASVEAAESSGGTESDASPETNEERDYTRRVLDRISSQDSDSGDDGDVSDASSGDTPTGSSIEAPTPDATNGQGGDPAENGRGEPGTDSGEGDGTTVSKRTTSQERVDELFDDTEVEDEEDGGGVLSDLRDRFS